MRQKLLKIARKLHWFLYIFGFRRWIGGGGMAPSSPPGYAPELYRVHTSELYVASLAIWDHTVLPARLPPDTLNTPRLTPARQAGTRFTYPVGMEG